MEQYSYPFPPGSVLGEGGAPGYGRQLHRGDVGAAERLDALGAAVLEWRVQTASGIRVLDDEDRPAPPVHEGQLAQVVIGLGPFRVRAPVRVVAVVDEPDLRGFVYGTRPGHPERGEEAFLVRRVGDRTVMELRILARAAFPYSLALPAVLLLQRVYTRRYLRALAD